MLISAELCRAIREHAARAYPEECCGLLLGSPARGPGLGEGRVAEVIATTNAWRPQLARDGSPWRVGHDDAAEDLDALGCADRYLIPPGEILQAQRRARAQGWELLGSYHSHPRRPAVPSAVDRALACPGYLYLIVARGEGEFEDVRLWSFDEAGACQPEALTVLLETSL